jgi:cardiolipin synthase A/B
MVTIITFAYITILLYTIGRILIDTHSASKALAYLLLVLAAPGIGMFFYYSVGINYRHRRSLSKMQRAQSVFDTDYFEQMQDETMNLLTTHGEDLGKYTELVHFLHQLGKECLSPNTIKLLTNGESKFPEVLSTLEQAKHFIHMEYYAWENDVRGNQVKDVLLKKAAEGVTVRVLYDDYASRKIKPNIVRELREGGVAIFPKIKVRLSHLANRLNHRDHRKVIIVDGLHGFLGGINISDRYDNSIDTGLWWRDTHVKATGGLALSLQRHFIVSWNASQPEPLSYSKELFPHNTLLSSPGASALAQVIAGGPVYPMSNIMLTYFRLFTLVRKKLYITNPYFIPSDSILDSLKQAALSGVDVRLLLPYKSDSALVGAASRFYFSDLLQAGVRIFLYQKGFVHAKTAVADGLISIVGSANMDIRSFDLNFEIMSIVYDKGLASQLEKEFQKDLEEAIEVTYDEWQKTPKYKQLIYSISRLISAFL